MTSNSEWIRVCRLEAIPDGKAVEHVGKHGVGGYIVYRAGESTAAFDNFCPHQGRLLNFAPGKFLFAPEGALVCPHHGATFAMPSGNCTGGPCRGQTLREVECKVTDGEVFIRDLG